MTNRHAHGGAGAGDGEALYALTFAPLACGSARWAGDVGATRAGPGRPLSGPATVRAAGPLLVRGPTMEVLLAGRVLQGLAVGRSPSASTSWWASSSRPRSGARRRAVRRRLGAAGALRPRGGRSRRRHPRAALGLRGRGPALVAAAALAHRADFVDATPGRPGGAASDEDDAGPARRRAVGVGCVAAVAGPERPAPSPGYGARCGLALVLVVPAPAAAARHARRPAGPAVGDRHPGPAECVVLRAEAYIVYVLQEQRASPGRAGISALTLRGASPGRPPARRRPGSGAAHPPPCALDRARAGRVGALALSVELHLPALVTGASYVLAGAGMGFGYPRTSVAMLAVSRRPRLQLLRPTRCSGACTGAVGRCGVRTQRAGQDRSVASCRRPDRRPRRRSRGAHAARDVARTGQDVQRAARGVLGPLATRSATTTRAPCRPC